MIGKKNAANDKNIYPTTDVFLGRLATWFSTPLSFIWFFRPWEFFMLFWHTWATWFSTPLDFSRLFEVREILMFFWPRGGGGKCFFDTRGPRGSQRHWTFLDFLGSEKFWCFFDPGGGQMLFWHTWATWFSTPLDFSRFFEVREILMFFWPRGGGGQMLFWHTWATWFSTLLDFSRFFGLREILMFFWPCHPQTNKQTILFHKTLLTSRGNKCFLRWLESIRFDRTWYWIDVFGKSISFKLSSSQHEQQFSRFYLDFFLST